MNRLPANDLHENPAKGGHDCAAVSLDLFYQVNSGEWRSVPPWADFFLRVGQVLAQPPNQNRIVIGVAVPIRSFAASLCAAGAVVAHLKGSLESDLAPYFEYLCGLPIGTGVTVLRSDKHEGIRQYPGVLAGLDEASIDSKDKSAPKVKLIRIQISRSTMRESKAGGRVFMVDARRADTIRVLDPDEAITAQDLPATPLGVSIRAVSDFSLRIIPGGASQYIAKSKVGCLLVGSPGTLDREINETTFGVGDSSGGISAGTLGEVLKVRRFSRTRRQFHSDIYTAASKWPPKKSVIGNPDLVIFDGAAGFMKWRDSFRESHLLIVLDQTEALFMEAVQRLNYEYSCRVDDDALPDFCPEPPPGTELTFFRESMS